MSASEPAAFDLVALEAVRADAVRVADDPNLTAERFRPLFDRAGEVAYAAATHVMVTLTDQLMDASSSAEREATLDEANATLAGFRALDAALAPVRAALRAKGDDLPELPRLARRLGQLSTEATHGA